MKPISLLIVTPVIAPPRPGLVESWSHRPHLVVVNGAVEAWRPILAEAGLWAAFPVDGAGGAVNLGCPASWNLAFRLADEAAIDYVTVTSQGLVLAGGTAGLAEAVADRADDAGLQLAGSFQKWHCLTIAVEVWRRVGPFDEALPIYADCDFTYRCRLADVHLEFVPHATLDFDDHRGTAVAAGAVPASLYERDLDRYVAKWGGEPYQETGPTPLAGWEGLADTG